MFRQFLLLFLITTLIGLLSCGKDDDGDDNCDRNTLIVQDRNHGNASAVTIAALFKEGIDDALFSDLISNAEGQVVIRNLTPGTYTYEYTSSAGTRMELIQLNECEDRVLEIN